jgi:queuine tRNA-ribosyltransferase
MRVNSFSLKSVDGLARRGAFSTKHGVFETPAFMPVGTKATVKGVDCERLKELGAQITLVNTYHLWLRPGPELIQELGGVHRFCNWSGPILSDSGGFQIFSLQKIRKISEEGVTFRSHIDGAHMFLSPEVALDIQSKLGVDIAMVLDECPAGDLDREYVSKSLDLTLRWAERAWRYGQNLDQSIFAITQGGMFADLRERSAQELAQYDFSGFAIGGLSVGEEKAKMYEVLDYHPQQLPAEKIRYLMGVGTPQDIVYAVSRGVDLFDCVMPTRSGRFGRAFISGDLPYINIKNSTHLKSENPLDADCQCLCCRNYSRAYVHHLFRNDEMLGPQLLSIHNLSYYQRLMRDIRAAIEQGKFADLFETEMSKWKTINNKGL